MESRWPVVENEFRERHRGTSCGAAVGKELTVFFLLWNFTLAAVSLSSLPGSWLTAGRELVLLITACRM